MLKVDLGCGTRKQKGFIGIDRFLLTGVDVVADLDRTLPFVDDSIDAVLASHSLEHVRDLMATMREIYRICKHGAQVCIVAPYHEQKLNLANPYHICVFNEHTPRFWTSYPDAPVHPAEFAHPHAANWGLSTSDHSDPGLDLRLVRMKFFYFPEYRDLSVIEQREARQRYTDVCDQIMFHLIVWKPNQEQSGISFTDHLSLFEPFEPDYIRQRKAREREELNESRTRKTNNMRPSMDQLHNEIITQEHWRASTSSDVRRLKELNEDIDRSERLLHDARIEKHELRMQVAGLLEKVETLSDQLHATKTALSKAQIETSVLSETFSGLRQENQELRSRLENAEVMKAKLTLVKAELEAANGLLAWYRSIEASWQPATAIPSDNSSDTLQLDSHWNDTKHVIENLFTQVCAFRASRPVPRAALLLRKDKLWDSVSPAFSDIKAFTSRHFWRSTRNLLILGNDLRLVPYREYVIRFPMQNLASVSLAICPLLPISAGSVGIEIVSSDKRILAQISAPLSAVRSDVPTQFALPQALSNLKKKWALRVFVKNSDVPVALYELVKYSAIRRRERYLPFVLFS